MTTIGKYTSVDAPKIKQRTVSLWLWQLDVIHFDNLLGKTLTLAFSRNKARAAKPPWLVKLRAELKVGDLVEFRPGSKWMRRRIKRLTDTTVEFETHILARDEVFPAHGDEEWTQE